MMPGIKPLSGIPAQPFETAVLRAFALLEFCPTVDVMIFLRGEAMWSAEYVDKVDSSIQPYYIIKAGPDLLRPIEGLPIDHEKRKAERL